MSDATKNKPAADDERLTGWLDAALEQRERELLQRELDEDPELRGELEALEQTVEVLRRMPPVRAPEDFLEGVTQRIRRRSRGSFFQPAKMRFPYEAAFNILLIAVLCMLYINAIKAPDDVEALESPRFSQQDAPDAVKKALARFGDVTRGPEDPASQIWRVAVDEAALPALKAAVEALDGARVGTVTRDPNGGLIVEVRVRR